MIRRRREELPDEMGAGQGLDAVEPAVPASGSRSGVVGYDPRDVMLVHLPRERPVQRLAQRGRPDRCEPCPGVRLAASAHVAYLAHEAGAAGVDALRELLQVLDDALVVQVDLRKVPLRIGRNVGRSAEHRERDPALRLHLVIPLVALRGHPALGETARVAGAHDAVPEGEMLQSESLKQRIGCGFMRYWRGLWHVNGLRFGAIRGASGVAPVTVKDTTCGRWSCTGVPRRPASNDSRPDRRNGVELVHGSSL